MNCDTLVIGSGIAGLWAALKAADHGSVIILTKKEESESNTNYAQGGIAGVLSPDDAPRLHIEDTLEAGAGLCHEDSVGVLVREGPDRIRELIGYGAEFTTVPGAKGEVLALGREGGHSRRRIVHAKDLTGREIERAVLAAVRLHPGITIFENHIALDLLIRDNTCYGAVALDRRTRDVRVFQANATVLASGGAGQIFPHTTNPAIATADGVAIGWRAGATVANLEFIQFHPTTLYHPAAQSFLISEAVRGAGGILKLSDGSTFMEKYHKLASLAPRDVVARAIDGEVKRRGEPCAYLDVTHLGAERLEERFPYIVATCREFGVDPATQWIPVVPAAHYSCGGLVTDLVGRTSINRLYASGEVSCTGVHGANRLASNSLLEAVVFSERAASDIATLKPLREEAFEAIGTGRDEPEGVAGLTRDLREMMWANVGIVRTDAGLAEAATVVRGIRIKAETMVSRCRPTGALLELRNMATTAALIVACASRRKESRGLQYNTDHPDRVESERHDTVLRGGEDII
jgi:L-aspartate oxidase